MYEYVSEHCRLSCYEETSNGVSADLLTNGVSQFAGKGLLAFYFLAEPSARFFYVG
jgi:hypothetical protein